MPVRIFILMVSLATALLLGWVPAAADPVSGEGKRLGLRRTTLTVREHNVYFEDRLAVASTVARSFGTVRLGGAVVLELDSWSVAAPYKEEGRLCFSQHLSLPCLEIEQTFPDVRGETLTHSYSLVDRQTEARLVVRLASHVLYTGPLNTHYRELADTRNISLIIPDEVRRRFVSELGSERSRGVRIVLDWLRLLYDRADQGGKPSQLGDVAEWTYGDLPLTHGFVALDVTFALMRALFGDAPADDELSNVPVDEFQIAADPMVMEPVPHGFLQRDSGSNVR